jgi:hypothetical protein
MKKTLSILCLIAFIFSSCAKGGCPTTDKRYFTRGVPKSKSLYKGYPSQRGNKSWGK